MVSNHNGHLVLTDQNFSTEVLQNPEPVMVVPRDLNPCLSLERDSQENFDKSVNTA